MAIQNNPSLRTKQGDSATTKKTDIGSRVDENQQRARELIKKAAGEVDKKERSVLIRKALECEIRSQTLEQSSTRLFSDSLDPFADRHSGGDLDVIPRTSREDPVRKASSGGSEDVEADLVSGQNRPFTPDSQPRADTTPDPGATAVEGPKRHDPHRHKTQKATSGKTTSYDDRRSKSPSSAGEIEIVDTLEVTISATAMAAAQSPKKKPRKLEIKSKKKPRKLEIRSH